MTTRKRQSLDGKWQFWLDTDASLTPSHLSQYSHHQIEVPGPWQAYFPDLRLITSPVWYRRLLEIPASWLEGALFLGFGAVDYRAEVWLNGVKVGEHEGGYLPFELEVTAVARPGENELVVCVTDPPELFPEIPHGKQSWYGPLSGIWQSVWLECRPLKHIRRVKITPTATTGEVSLAVTVNQHLVKTDEIQVDFFAPQGEEVATVITSATHLTVTLEQPQLWDIETPHLYTARITLKSAAGQDVVVEQFGFRTIETREGQLTLNGRPLYLRGALDQDYYPHLIATPPSLEYIEAQFRQARQMGLNCLRIHIKVADPRYYIAADRVGLLIWTELPNWEQLTESAKQRGRETMAGMIERDWNHPSIIIWTIINEAWGTELATNPDHRIWLAEMFDWVKQLDSTRLVVDNSPCFPNFHVRSDLDDFHYYAAMPDGAQRWDQWVDALAHHPQWLYGPEYQANPRVHGDELGAPLIVSEFGNWGLPDIALLRGHDGADPWWFESGWDWGSGDVYPHAAEHRFYALHLDRVFGDYAGLARASQWAQFEALQYQIETMRLYPQIVGYIITEFTDLHWECNGLLDMMRHPKAHYHRLAEINADTVIIPRVQRRTWWSGQTAVVTLHLSHFGSEPIAAASLVWSLVGDGVPEMGGTIPNLVPAYAGMPTQVVELPPLQLDLPALPDPTRLSLHLTLVGPSNLELARNELVLLVFPRMSLSPQPIACTDEKLSIALAQAGYTVTSEASPDIPLIVTIFNETTRRFVEKGGRVLFLAERPEALQTVVPRLSLQVRKGTAWSGDWASSFAWYRRDLWAGGLPGDGRFDFTFSSVLPETVISSVRTADFRQEVLAGLFVGWLRRPAGLVQKLPLGKGELLVSTLRLQNNIGLEPIAEKLMSELLSCIDK
jgi:hypothetical protein